MVFLIIVCTELKEDIKGQKEFKEYLTTLELQRADLQGRIDKNKAWVVSGRQKYMVCRYTTAGN
jgi:thioredoxin-related protein